MRTLFFLIQIALLSFLTACGGETKPATPLETYRTYTKAVKQKDTTTMKLLLSGESLKMHEQQAKAMGTTVDEIVKRESLFSDTQSRVEYRNEVIEGERATIEIRNPSGTWEKYPFVFEDGQWKIDAKGFADRLTLEIEAEKRKADEMHDMDRIQPDDPRLPPGPVTNSNSVIPD